MLREPSVGSTLTLVEKLTASNVVVEPIADTPLAKLQAACYTPMLEVARVEGMDISTIMYNLVNTTMQPGVDGKVEHDKVMEEVVDVIAKNVQANLQLARNVVNPVVKQAIERVEKEIQEAGITAVNLLNVVPDNYHDIWNNSAIEGMIDRYSQTAMEDLAVNHIFPVKDAQSLTDLMVTGASRLDADIKQWEASLPAGFVVDAYNAFYAASTVTDKFSAHFDINVDKNKVLAIHLIARRLEKEIPEGVNMDLNEYRNYIVNVIAQSGRALCRIFDKRKKDAKLKVLVKNWPAVNPDSLGGKDSIILVNGDVYNDWLNAGGCPEILFGAFLIDRNTDFASLIEKKDQYVAAWNRQATILRSRASADKFNVTISAIRRAMTSIINEAELEQLPIASRGVFHERLVEEISEITIKDLEDLTGCIREIVCEVLFAHTDAERILETIDEIASQNPGMDIREVALLATIDHVVDWVAHLIKPRVVQLNV